MCVCVCACVCVAYLYIYFKYRQHFPTWRLSSTAPASSSFHELLFQMTHASMHTFVLYIHIVHTYIRTYIHTYVDSYILHTHMQNMNVLSIFSSGVAAALSATQRATGSDSHCHSLWHCECRAEQVNDTKS